VKRISLPDILSIVETGYDPDENLDFKFNELRPEVAGQR
jgi:hypothetical protein